MLCSLCDRHPGTRYPTEVEPGPGASGHDACGCSSHETVSLLSLCPTRGPVENLLLYLRVLLWGGRSPPFCVPLGMHGRRQGAREAWSPPGGPPQTQGPSWTAVTTLLPGLPCNIGATTPPPGIIRVSPGHLLASLPRPVHLLALLTQSSLPCDTVLSWLRLSQSSEAGLGGKSPLSSLPSAQE